jgi:hypothetical protein
MGTEVIMMAVVVVMETMVMMVVVDMIVVVVIVGVMAMVVVVNTVVDMAFTTSAITEGKKYQKSKNDFSRKDQNSKNDFSRKDQHRKNGFSRKDQYSKKYLQENLVHLVALDVRPGVVGGHRERRHLQLGGVEQVQHFRERRLPLAELDAEQVALVCDGFMLVGEVVALEVVLPDCVLEAKGRQVHGLAVGSVLVLVVAHVPVLEVDEVRGAKHFRPRAVAVQMIR